VEVSKLSHCRERRWWVAEPDRRARSIPPEKFRDHQSLSFSFEIVQVCVRSFHRVSVDGVKDFMEVYVRSRRRRNVSRLRSPDHRGRVFRQLIEQNLNTF
jgi:hypothetical protein